MKTLSPDLTSHLARRATRLALCWQVTRTDAVVIRGTEHDADIVITTGDYAGTYAGSAGISGSTISSGSDMAVDNLDVDGSLVSLVDMSAADIEAGLFDDAEVVLFACQWDDPDGGQVVLRYGNLGNIERTSEGRYKTELRGLMQRLTQKVTRTYSATCDAELGDSRCLKDVSDLILTATVTAVTSRRRIDCLLTGTDSSTACGDYDGGRLIGLTGDNAGYERRVRRDCVGSVLGHLETWEEFPVTIEVGDTFELRPGCDKTLATCRDRFDNVLNFQGYGVYTPGVAKMVKGPDRGDGPV